MAERPLCPGPLCVPAGERSDLALVVSERFSGSPVEIPLHVWRAEKEGPTVLVCAAVHGDEINGTGVVKSLITEPPFALEAGNLILVPVINVPGFERRSRYLPDRRDLNRSFPGTVGGSLSSRFAHRIFNELVAVADYCLDFHTAAVQRTNYPNVRGQVDNPEVARIARAFGTELIVAGAGPRGSLRRVATENGCPGIILEAGEVWKMEPSVVETGRQGVRNVLIELDMVKGRAIRPPYQAVVDRTTWVRADRGGLLEFHIAPGEVVETEQPLATTTDLLGRRLSTLLSPQAGVVLGMTTLPSVVPGNPVCHIAVPSEGIGPIRAALLESQDGSRGTDEDLRDKVRDDLATSVTISEPEP